MTSRNTFDAFAVARGEGLHPKLRELFDRTAARPCSDLGAGGNCAPLYGVAIKPLAVATIQRLPQRTIESIRPMPGTVSPRIAIRIPSGPSRTAVPPRTSRTVQPSIVVGFVSGAGLIGPLGVIEPVGVISAWAAGDAMLDELTDRLAPSDDAARGLA